MNFNDLLYAAKKVQDMPPQPEGIVLSRQGWYDIKLTATDTADLAGPPGNPGKIKPFMGVDLLPRQDVPDAEVWVFYDRELLIRYWELAEKIGHKAAIQRISADVDEELIMEAELRALLECC